MHAAGRAVFTLGDLHRVAEIGPGILQGRHLDVDQRRIGHVAQGDD